MGFDLANINSTGMHFEMTNPQNFTMIDALEADP